MPLTDYAFKTTFTPYRQLIILGERIDEKLIKSISPLNAELDYPDLTTFNIGNVSITLFDPDGEFNPNNSDDNFWTRHWNRADVPEHYNQVGYKGTVEIHIGYDRDGTIESEKIFEGEVANIRVNLQPPEVIIEAVDASQNLRPTKVDDFGIPRKVVLPEDEDATYTGRYPFPAYSIPAERSVSARTSIDQNEMADVGTIGTEGTASPLNYQIADNSIETEGGPLLPPNVPVATFKDIYRYKRIDTLLKNLLRHYDVQDFDIDILPQQTERPHFAANGRVGWELENLSTDLAREWNWDGYVKDVAYDSTNKKYYMLYGQQANHQPDRLIAYDVATDSWERIATTNITLRGVPREYEMWQLATDDFDNFYILATVHQTDADDELVRGTYDALESTFREPSQIAILRYQISTKTWTEIDDARGNQPQLGIQYRQFPHPLAFRNRLPMLPDTRTSFVIANFAGEKKLVYRGKDGIHTYQLSDGTKSTLKTVPTAHLRSMDFWIGDANQFFAWVERDDTNNISTLRIDDGDGNAVVNQTYNSNHTFASLVSVSDMIYHNGSLYAVLQTGFIQAYLVKIDVANGTVESLKYYDFYVKSARSPVVHNGEIHYFEGSHYQYDPRLGGTNLAFEAYPDDTGHLIKITGDGVLDLGLCWRSAFQNPIDVGVDIGFGRHGGTASPMISDGETIHFWAGYGDLHKLNDAPANDIDNWQWGQYSKQVPQRIPIFHTNGKQTWGLMNELARLTNATMSYRNGRFSFLPRATRQTNLRLDLSETTTSHAAVIDAARFPTSGMVLINDELIAYTTKSADNSDIELLTRGEEKSQPTTHKKGDTVLFVDALVFNHPDKQNLGSLKFKPDFLGIYNQLTAKLTPIAGENAAVFIENPESVAANGEKPRDFSFDMLTWHERPWAALLLDDYLLEMQQAQFEVELELPWSPHLKLGQTLVVDQQVVAHLRWTPVRILRISHDFDARTTRVTGRTFGLRRISQAALAFDGDVVQHRIYVVNEQITPFTLPTASGGLGTLTYSLSQLPAGLSFDSDTREVSGTPTALGTRIMTYTATDMSTVPQTAMLQFRITIVNPLAFDDTVPTELIYEKGCYIDYQLPAASGGIGRIFYEAMGLPTFLNFDELPPLSRGDGELEETARRITGIMQEIGQFGIQYSAWDSAESPTYVTQGFNIRGENLREWSAFFVSDTRVSLVHNSDNKVRVYDLAGNRVLSEDLPLPAGAFNWTGAALTDNRKIFVNNTTGEAHFFDDQNREQSSEKIALGDGDWQDVCRIGTNKLGFLDRDAGAVRVYGPGARLGNLASVMVRMASDDIVFGMMANWRGIAANAGGSMLYVLVADLPFLLAWDIGSGAFVPAENIPIIPGSVGWQAVALMSGDRLGLVRANSTRVVIVDMETQHRRVADDLLL
ncbi:hypothetical protein C6499_09550 [Candidatus Poribacteria bacterium]|nr:MAG: hypothetical protein C6499_09550 [Candidatus Poribacteria bacterium]